MQQIVAILTKLQAHLAEMEVGAAHHQERELSKLVRGDIDDGNTRSLSRNSQVRSSQ